MIPSNFAALMWVQSWQLAALVGGVLLASRLIARDRPHLAHALWLVVLLKCVTPPLWSSPSGVFCWLQPSHAAAACTADVDNWNSPAPLISPERDSLEVVVALRPRPQDSARESTTNTATAAEFAWLDWLMFAWLAGAALSLGLAILRYGAFLWRLRRYPRRNDPELAALVAKLARRLRIGRRVGLLITESRIGPAVIGLGRPTILLPAAIAIGKSPVDLEPILAHELLHVRRGDLWLAAASILARSLWFFHPLVWLACRLLAREAERCCDEQVLAELRCEPARYARSLLGILEHKQNLLAVPAFPGVRPVDITSSRLERIMRLGHGCQRRTPWWCWLVMLLAAAVVLPGAAFVAGAKEPLKQRPKKPRQAPHVAALIAPESSERTARVYAVRDLLERLTEELNVGEAEAKQTLAGHLAGFVSDVHNSRQQVAALVNSDAGVSGSLAAPDMNWSGRKLVVVHTAAGHARVAQALALLREFGFRQVTIQVRMLSGPPELLEKLRAKWSAAEPAALADTQPSGISAAFDYQPLERPASTRPGDSWTRATSIVEKNMPVLYAVVDASQAEALLESGQAHPRVNVLQAPRVTVFNGQSATVMDATHRPFVVGVKPVTGSGPTAHEPQIRVVTEGTTIRMRPVLRDGGTLQLDYEFTLSRIRGVETAKIPQGRDAEPLTVQVPEVASLRFGTSLELPLGRTLAVGAVTSQEGKPEAMIVLLEAREIDPRDAQVAARPAPHDAARASYHADDLQRLPAAAARPAPPEQSLAERLKHHPILAALERPIFAAHGKMKLKDAIESIGKAAGINICLDSKSLAEEGVTPDQAVDVPPQQTSLAAGELLAQLLAPLSLEFCIEREALRVRGWHELYKRYTKVYHVADIVVAVPTIVAIRNGKPFAQPPRQEAKTDFEPLLELIRSTIAPQSWDTAGGPGSLEAFETNLSLVVSQTQDIHEQIADLLQLRRLQDLQVALELQVLAVPENFFERVGLDFDLSQADADIPAIHARLDPKQAAAVARAAGSKTPAATRVTLMNGQGADLDLPLAGTQRMLNLKLIPEVHADLQGIRLKLAAGVDDPLEALRRADAYRCQVNEVLLLDLTENVPVVGVPVLRSIPHMERLFSQTPPAGSRVLLLVSPQIILAGEVEEKLTATRATQAARQ
jgi:beta-lactamase regulating signal transducer with metallopeptidase domain